MDLNPYQIRFRLAVIGALVCIQFGCSQVRVPRIDPSGQRIFLPAEQTTTVVPIGQTVSAGPGLGSPVFVKPPAPEPCPEVVGTVPCPPPCPSVSTVSPTPTRRLDVVKDGSLVLKPTKIIAPINSDVVIFGGLCGADGYFRKRETLEWSLSQESVGHFVEVREGSLSRLHKMFGRELGKHGTNYAVGRTSSSEEVITKGTDTVIDDMLVQAGQGWVSLTSPSEGTSHVTGMAPKAKGWDKRRKTATIHWLDANWDFPPSVTVQSGTEHDLTTLVRRATTKEAIEGWLVNYTILPGGTAAGFAPAGATTAQNIRTGSLGQATVRLRQATGQTGPGTTQVRVDIIRPGLHAGDPDRLNVATAVISVRWTAPALTFVATGPEVVGLDTPFNYRVEVFNPGDQTASGVTASAILPPGLTLISANPQPGFAGGTLSWNLGEVVPGQPNRIIDLTVKATTRGTLRPCFQVYSNDTRLSRLEKCLETTVAAPCLSMQIDGPDEAQVGDQITYRIRMQNQCNEPLTNVRLVDTYGSGLEAPGLPSPLAYQPFDLAPGATSDVIELTFIVKEAGTVCHLIQVTADGGHTAESRQCIEATSVARPDFQVSVESVNRVRFNDRVLIRATITNTGNTTLPDMTVLHDYTASLAPQNATDGWQPVDQGLQWRLRPLPVGQSVVLEVDSLAQQGDAAAVARFTCITGAGLQREGSTRIAIEGAPQPVPENNQPEPPEPNNPIRIAPPTSSDRLEIGITSFDEPVNPGDNVNYQIRVENDRAVNDSNVVITLSIPEGMQYIGGRATDLVRAVSQSPDGRTVTMETRRELRAGQAINFRAIVRATTPGKKTFNVSVRSGREPDGVTRSIETTVNRQ